MALTQSFIDAVSQGNILRVKIMLKDSLLVDKSFSQFDEMLSYAESKISNLWVSDEDDDEVFSQADEELNKILSGLIYKFSRRRVNHLKGMINKLYPSQHENNQSYTTGYTREYARVIEKTPKVKKEYEGIKADMIKIMEVDTDIYRNACMDTRNMELIRTAAMSIVKHCDKITGK